MRHYVLYRVYMKYFLDGVECYGVCSEVVAGNGENTGSNGKLCFTLCYRVFDLSHSGLYEALSYSPCTLYIQTGKAP